MTMRSTGMVILASSLLGCSMVPVAPGDDDVDDEPPAYVNVVQTEEVRVQLLPLGVDSVPPNDHPAAFEPEQLQALLMSLRIQSEGEGVVTLTSPSRMELVSDAIAEGFARARPTQDVSVIFYRTKSDGILFGSSRYVTSARMFFRDDKLHMVFGELDAFHGPFRDTNINPVEPGERGSQHDVGGDRLVQNAAWEWYQNRGDWIAMKATPQAIRQAAEAAPGVTSVGGSEGAQTLRYGPAAGGREKSADNSGHEGRARSKPEHGPAVVTSESAPDPAATRGDRASAQPAIQKAPVADKSETDSGGEEAADWARIEKRLQALRRLREQELISDQDYEDKKDELLEDLP